MIKNIITTIVVFIFFSVILYGCNSAEQIKKEIDKANYCTEKSDCVLVGTKCPFGCYIYANKEQAERIDNLVDSFDSKCVYGCVYCPDVECKDNKCTPVCE